jgi:hypothetical protein
MYSHKDRGGRRILSLLGAVCIAATVALTGREVVPVAFAAGDANQEQCRNEAMADFRTALPDCRAYEMVTPSYKQGYPVHIDAIGGDGSTLVGWSWGAFAGAMGAPQLRKSAGTEYQLARTVAGWLVTPLAPASTAYLGSSSWYSTSSDMSRTLWSMPTAPVGQDDFYVREHGGVFFDAGPATPPSDGPTVPPAFLGSGPALSEIHFEGASSDLSHVLYSITAQTAPADLWPGDGTSVGREDLYEYVGSGNSEPTMVGVGGGLGSRSLIGECGVYVGGPHSKYNALAADGGTVFFTPAAEDEGACGAHQPPVDDLFARRNQSQTVELSVPPPAACTTPACQSAPLSDALFEGASHDGSKAFFTSTQQLTDQASEDATSGDSANNNVGTGCPEAHESGCNLYEYDFADPVGDNLHAVSQGSATPHVQGVARISQDGSHVYFIAQGVLTGSPNGQGQTAQPGANNLYLFERDVNFPEGRTVFIATLAPTDEELWGNGGNNDNNRPAQATPDGRFLVFQSHADLTPDDTSSGVWQVFEYDTQTGRLIRVSIGQGGFNHDGNTSADDATIPGPYFGTGNAGDEPQPAAVSDDGSYVFFQSADGLTPQALNDITIDSAGHKANNVYEYRDGQVFLISDGQDVSLAGDRTGSNVNLLGASGSGADVFFTSGDRLSEQDVDTQQDVYDARLEGGFLVPTSPSTCRGVACQGALSATPFTPAAGSVTQVAGENLPPPPASKPPASKPRPTVKVRTARVEGNAVLVTIATTQRATVTVSGRGLKTTKRTLGAGTHLIRVRLTSLGKAARTHHKRTKIKVSAQNTQGSATATISIKLMSARGGRGS